MRFFVLVTACLLAAKGYSTPMPSTFSFSQRDANSPIGQTKVGGSIVQLMGGWKNVTLGGLFPEETPDPAALFTQAARELCHTLTCRESDRSKTTRTQVLIEDPTSPGRRVLRPLDIWATASGIASSPAVLDALIQFVEAASSRLSWWTEEDYVVVDTRQVTKEGVAQVRELKHKDRFVASPNLILAQLVDSEDKVDVQSRLQIELHAEFADHDGLSLVCDLVTVALGEAAGAVLSGGGAVIDTLSSSFETLPCDEANDLAA